MQQAHTPTRSLPLAGATHFRDLGGYVGHGGQAVKWRRLFRSDHLAGLTPEDQALLADIRRPIEWPADPANAQPAPAHLTASYRTFCGT